MAREVDEWIGRTDDDWPPPPRVRDRIAARQDNCCAECARPLGGANPADFDHRIAIINGGANREGNVQALCRRPCHRAKTNRDLAIKAKDARVRKKHLGIGTGKKRLIAGSRGTGVRIPINGPPYRVEED
jgi:5-methylcytosine-specific restriction protein A